MFKWLTLASLCQLVFLTPLCAASHWYQPPPGVKYVFDQMTESQVMRLVREKREYLNYKDENQQTAYHFAATKGSYIFVALLRAFPQYRENINAQDAQGDTPIMLAIKRGNKRVIHQLLIQRPDLSITNNQGQTALTLAQQVDKKMAAVLNDPAEFAKRFNIFYAAKKNQDKTINKKNENSPPLSVARNYTKGVCELYDPRWVFKGKICYDHKAHDYATAIHLNYENQPDGLRFEGRMVRGDLVEGKLFNVNELLYEGKFQNNKPLINGRCQEFQKIVSCLAIIQKYSL